MRSPADGIQLEPHQGAAIINGELSAVAVPAWLTVSVPLESMLGRWIKVTYAASLTAMPSRPLIRFVGADGSSVEHVANAPLTGRAEWTGWVPPDTVAIHVSPSHRLGPIRFRIDAIEPLSTATLLARGLASNPAWVYEALLSRMRSQPELARHQLRFAIGSVAMSRYDRWSRQQSRPIEPHGLDKPADSGANGPRFELVAALKATDAGVLRTTVLSLQRQFGPPWRLHAVRDDDTPAATLEAFRAMARDDARLCKIGVPADARAGRDQTASSARSWWAAVTPGDILPDYALAALADAVLANPDAVVVYGDEDAIAPDGRLHSPILKPDWSPRYEDAAPHIGRLAFVRDDALGAVDTSGPVDLARSDSDLMRAVLHRCDRQEVVHLARILYRRARVAGKLPRQRRHIEAEPSKNIDADWPEVAAIIPTRDRADLLAECLRGLKERTDYPRLKVVIVDNGSTEPAALRLLDSLAGDARFLVLPLSGPFNHSRLSNAGARATDAPMLLFLNNDIVMRDPGWLKAMVVPARRPDIGLVGAKLLLPDGRVQHAGLVLGMGGVAGHVYYGHGAEEHGYLDQLVAPREVSAVTAACAAVERRKFEAVGGFDEVNLPAELNDVDLCLRLAERGWTNFWTPEAVLVHVQSASRGAAASKPFDAYSQERAFFTARWGHLIRHDPYFHPALSLFARQPALAR